MSKNFFSIKGVNQGFSIESEKITAIGGAASPYLQIPLFLELNPIADRNIPINGGITSFIITNIEASLSFEGFQFKAAEINRTSNILVDNKRSLYFHLEFPLDKTKISIIEKHRKTNLSFTIRMVFHYGIFATIPFITNVESEKRGFITEYNGADETLTIEISQSQWISKILLGLGFKAFKLIEMPEYSELIPEQFKTSLSELAEVERYYKMGEYDKAVGHCRSALDPFNKIMPGLKNYISSKSEFEWIDEINKKTFEWLDALWKATKNFTSKTHHPPTMGHFDRHDAEIIHMMTTAIVAYIGKIDLNHQNNSEFTISQTPEIKKK